MKTYIIYTMVAITFFYITIGEKDRMGTRAIMRENVVVSGAYIPS
tara:strand:- start:364 stop:498 length:135 start_codon:yes stop_codon:yes gene_type:complete